MRLPVFPRVTVAFLLFEGDEEFPADCKVLFEPTVSAYLSPEDAIVVCEDAVRRLRARAAGDA